MSRIFPHWLDAWEEYAQDDFCPQQFNLWSGLSTVAGALERKVWLPWSDTFSYYPNIYVLLVSLPGIGKSTALNKAVDLIQEVGARNPGTLKLLPSQVTEAKFIELMSESSTFQEGTTVNYHSSGYYWASEASASLKNVFGDFIACLTDFYDCPKKWQRATKKDGNPITVTNACVNILAGSTFDYLGKLVTDENIMGGFASRLIYVVHREKSVRKQQFQLGGMSPEVSKARADYRRALVHDLELINRMVGAFSADAEFQHAWQEWHPQFEAERQAHESEKLQSLLVRTNTNIIKLSMLFSAARSDEKVLRLDDWKRAQAALLPIQKEIPLIFRNSRALDTKTQSGMNNAVLSAFTENDGVMPIMELYRRLASKGFDPRKTRETIEMFKQTRVIETVGANSEGALVKFLGNPNDYF